MEANALICDGKQNFSIETVELGELAPDQVLIRTVYSGVSIGTEFALIRNKISWGPFPLCTGYMGTGVIEAVGSKIKDFAIGDAVYFRANDRMTLADGRGVSCVSGTHCSRILTRPHTTHGVAHMIPGASMEVASMFVLPAVGLNGVDMANPRMGQTVVVHGAGLIGLGVVAACAHRGCTVIAVDLDDLRLSLAREMGADRVINSSRKHLAEAVKAMTGEGADVVFECTGLAQCIGAAVELCRTQGRFVWQGNYGADAVPLDFLAAHVRRLKMFFPCDDGLQPCRRAVVKNIASGSLPWERCLSHRVPFREAPAMFERVDRGGDSEIVGVVINWED